MFLFHGIVGTPDWVGKLSPGFASLEMMPSLVPRPNIYLGLGEQPANLQQLNFVTEQKDIIVTFESDRYIIQMQVIPNQKLPEFEDFIDMVNSIVKTINEIVEGKAKRIAFVTTGLCKKMEAEQLNVIHKKLFNLPKEFMKNDVVEWNSRQVYRTNKDINGKNELLNVILNINRIKLIRNSDDKPKPYDRIEVGFDINTFQGNTSQRFSVADVICFLNEAAAIKNTLEESLQEIIKL
jgi:hypothetical protein